ncbi:MAG: hypothetical protein WC073_05850 [Sterolibacterium sp.]
MDIDHIKLQYVRLERHHSSALKEKDPISFLDLSHALRIWVDMKGFVDAVTKENGLTLGLANFATPKEVKKILKGSKHTYLPLASGVESPGIEVKGVRVIDRALSPEEIKKLYEAGPPVAQKSKLSFSEWLASGVYEVPSGEKDHPHLKISREILIKRVANILGASHPAGTEAAEAAENRFDPYVLDLHGVQLADGYPATYYQLLEIANDILEHTKCLFDFSGSQPTEENQTRHLGVWDVLAQKDVTDAIFKNLTWYLACAAILKFTGVAGVTGHIALALCLFAFFIFLFALNMIFGAKNILLPVDSAFGDTLANIKNQNALPDQTDLSRIKRTLLYIFGTRPGWFYFAISSAYVLLAFQLVDFAAKQFPTK